MNHDTYRGFEPENVVVPAHHFFAGKPSTTGPTISVIRPSDGLTHAQLPCADAQLIDAAVRSAVEAQSDWAALKPRQRGRLLHRLADLVDKHAEELAQLEAVVSSRPIVECRTIDVPTAAEYLRYYGEWCDKVEGMVTASGDDAVSLVLREPYGVVAIITPWNFPLVLATWKLAPALAAGNAVVIKPSELTPFSITRVAELAVEAGLPAGLLNVVHGDGPTAGRALTTHPDVAMVSFTGSTAVGGRIMSDVGMTGIKPLSLELGGKNPQLVFADCGDLNAVADHIAWGITRNAGQLCYAGSRLVVERPVAEALLNRIAERMGQLRSGPTWSEETTLAPIISQRQADRIARIIDQSVSEGASVHTGGTLFEQGGGCFFQPTLLLEMNGRMTGFREEIFGPVLGVQVFDTINEGLRLAQHPRYGLTASVFTRDGAKALKAAKTLRTGTVWINRWGRTADMITSPFGGYGQSGFGKESGRAGVEGFMRQKAVWIDLAEHAELAHAHGPSGARP
ncbi:MAG: aldehyde dehydrogenase [Gammaproteobacteria bacterium]|nr:aldehyde dehydrogenase [Gammaproteobacteria bacterium]